MDGIAWEDHGNDSIYPHALDKGNDSEANQVSWLIQTLCSFMTDYDTEKFFKKLGGRRDVDDAFLRLDSLTRDETLIGVAEVLDVAFDVNGNVQGLKVLTEDIRDHVQAVKERA